ncbi:hypothetical protein BH24ACT7_BH24ACT7_05020 [soil metagenome]
MRRRLLVHPWLFAVYPIVYLWSVNVDEVGGPGDTVPSLVVVLGSTALLLVLGRLLLRDWLKAGVITSLLLLLAFSYGHVWRAIDGAPLTEAGGRDGWLLAVWGVLAVVGLVALWRAGGDLGGLTRVLNVVSVVLVALASVTLVTGMLRDRPPADVDIADGIEAAPIIATPAVAAAGTGLPDIYLLVFDRYGGERTLAGTYRWDNTGFLAGLEERGFYVAHDAHTNYPATAHSLAASLNLRYLDELTETAGPATGDWDPVYSMVSDNEVSRFLDEAGYRQVQIPSWWEPTRDVAHADVTLTYDPLSEFSRALFDTTALQSAVVQLGLAADRVDPRRVAWNRVRFQLEQITDVERGDQPTFVFAHVLLPHHPYVFDADGSFLTIEELDRFDVLERYVNQVRYANDEIYRIVDELLDVPADEQPIILVQSDEGPPPRPRPGAPPRPGDDTPYWLTYSDGQLRQKFGILNTFYLPGYDGAALYQQISPVNNFRVVLNVYFGTDLPLLDDRSYVWTDRAHLYEFTDVTARLR